MVFKDKNVGNRLRFEKRELKGVHQTTDPLAVPIEITKAQFEINHGNHKYTRTQFPVILAYAVTAHKSQGATLSEVIVDFTPDRVDGKINKPYIIEGSFYVAITRCKLSENLYFTTYRKLQIKSQPLIQVYPIKGWSAQAYHPL